MLESRDKIQMQDVFNDVVGQIKTQLSQDSRSIINLRKVEARFLIQNGVMYDELCYCTGSLTNETFSDYWWAMWCFQLLALYKPLGDA